MFKYSPPSGATKREIYRELVELLVWLGKLLATAAKPKCNFNRFAEPKSLYSVSSLDNGYCSYVGTGCSGHET